MTTFKLIIIFSLYFLLYLFSLKALQLQALVAVVVLFVWREVKVHPI